jgi:tripartite-type tricarboxylate transporter receptor subunit TctC
MTTTLRALLCLAFAVAGFASAADYPNRPVKWVVPYPPGGSLTLASIFSRSACDDGSG